jgi:hypothetical protein
MERESGTLVCIVGVLKPNSGDRNDLKHHSLVSLFELIKDRLCF